MTRSRAEWRLALPTHYRLQRDDDAQPFILSSMPVSFHSYKHAKSKSVPTLVAVSAKPNPRFGLIGILNRNMYKRAHDNHPHHLALLSLRRWAQCSRHGAATDSSKECLLALAAENVAG